VGYFDVFSIYCLLDCRYLLTALEWVMIMGADNNKIVTRESAADAAVGASYLFLGLAVILFLSYLLAPIFGGKLSFKALAVYASWAGYALLLRYVAKKVQKGTKVRKQDFTLLSAYGVLCSVLWFSFPYSILFSILIVFGTVVSYKAQKKRLSNAREPKNS
jgi:hypothetical protein